MAYDTIERSNYDAKPVVLYTFSLGSKEWHYAAAEEEVVLDIGGVVTTFLPVAISDNGVSQTGEVTSDDFVITAPTDLDFITLFYGTPPSLESYATVRNWHIGESEAPVVGVYSVRTARRTTVLGWEIVCRALTASLNRNGLRLGWGRNCPHALYDQSCQVNPETYKRAITVQGLTGVSIVSTDLSVLGNGYLSGGYFEWEWMPGVIEKRAIESSSGSVLVVLGTTDGLSIGTVIYAYPGCNRTISMCDSRFANVLNYGGYPHMPGKSPFDGDPVF